MGIQERKEREKERRRNEIIDAAERVIFEHGIDKATVEGIAEIAELSKATVYLYFTSKEEIYFAISMRGQKRLFSMIEQEVKNVTGTVEKILTFLRTVVVFHKRYPNYFNAFFYFLTNNVHFNRENPYVIESRERHQKYLKRWIELIQKGKEEGIIRQEVNPINTVLLLWMQLMGLLKIYSVIEPRLQEDFSIQESEMLDDFFSLVLKGMTTP